MRRILLFFILIFLIQSTALAASPKVGTTFSKVQAVYLDLDWKETYLAILELKWDIIRLGAYWREIEKTEGKFDFSELDWQISQAKARKIPIALTVGMKAPRWPEYYIPDWLWTKTKIPKGDEISKDPVILHYTLRFIKEVIKHYKNEKAIKYIQVENEALNKFGENNWQLSKNFLQEEVRLVRSTDPLKRPIILTTATYPNKLMRFFARLTTKGNFIEDNLDLCDILGINIYPIVGHKFLWFEFHFTTDKTSRDECFLEILKMAQDKGKPLWITELQAEPWEAGKLVHKKEAPPVSASPRLTESYYKEIFREGFSVVLLWGAEFWYHRKTVYKDNTWWNMAEDLIRNNSKTKKY